MTCLILLASCLGSEPETDSKKHDAGAGESVPALYDPNGHEDGAQNDPDGMNVGWLHWHPSPV